MKDSYRRYYETNRVAILHRMRERYVAWKIKRDAELEKDPSLWEAEREKATDKYHRRVAKRTKQLIDGWLADSNTSETFKAFLQSCLKDDKDKTFTPRTLEQLYAVGGPVSALIAV